ncbi:MAG: DUF6785 family protein [Armatimonadota bacterium]
MRTTAPASAERATSREGVTARAVAIALLLTPFTVLFLVRALWVWGWFSGQNSLFDNAVAALFAVSLGSLIAGRLRPSWRLSGGEVMAIYALLVVVTGLTVSMWHFGGALAGNIALITWFATPENGWQTYAWPYLADWLIVRDAGALEGFFLGHASPYRWFVLRAWLTPALWWTAFVTVLLFVCLCLNSIVRRRWEDEEKLAFPIATLPIHVADERLGLLRNKLFWAAVAFSGGLGVWNQVASVLPALPGVPLWISYSDYVANMPPWNFIRQPTLGWAPGVIGLCYLMPLDLAFSLLFFDLFWVAEHVLSGYLGWSTNARAGFPYGDRQVAGGLLAILAITVWLDRGFLKQALRRAAGVSSRLGDDGREAFTYRGAVIGVLAGSGFLWCFLVHAGMSGLLGVAFIALYFGMIVVLSRVRAQLGPPSHQFYGATPDAILQTFLGTRNLGARNLGVLALLNPYLKQQSSNPAPSQLEALRMAANGRMDRRRLAWALAGIVPVGMACYFWANLHVGYQMGMATGKANHWNLAIPRWNYEALTAAVRYPSGADAAGASAIGIGFAFTLLLAYLKLRFAWWPLHPVAFPLAIADSILEFTAAIFVAWLIKGMLLRYGGLRAHRTALPIFLGFIVGESTVYTVQAVVREIFGVMV